MSALRGSRNAADFSTAIAPSQSSAASAFLPAANSGSSFAQSASGIATVMVQIGHSLGAAACSAGFGSLGRIDGWIAYAATLATSAPSVAAMAIERIMPAILSLPRQERLGLPYFLPLGIGVLGEVYELAKIFSGLRSVAHRIGRACGTPESAVAVGRLLESGLVFLQRGRGLADFQQEFRQHLT